MLAKETAMASLDADKKRKALKAFRDLWVAGTVGGFLAALMRSVPLDVGVLAKGPDCLFTLDLVLRYAYLVWFIAYFLLSNLTDKEPDGCDVTFDLIQSAASYAAAFALGLVVHGEGYQFGRSAKAFEFANGAILVICVVSFVIYAIRDKWEEQKKVHWLRIGGAVMAGIGIFISKNDPLSGVRLAALTGTLIVLAVMLTMYARIRISELK
jgi:hypothetical protein